MEIRCCMLIVFIIQFASLSARVISNGISNRAINFASYARGLPNELTLGRSYNGFPINKQLQVPIAGNNFPFAKSGRTNFGNSNNAIFTNLPNQNALVDGINSGIDLPKANSNEFLVNNKIAMTTSSNQANGNLMPVANAPVNLANKVDEIILIPSGTIMANGNKAKSVKLSIGYPPGSKNGKNGKFANENIDLKITADNLEIRGSVAITGSMPFTGAVALNGKVPSEGKGSVNLNYGLPKKYSLVN